MYTLAIDKVDLGEWATEQGKIWETADLHPEEQAQIASVIIACKGVPGGLVIVSHGNDDWMDEKALSLYLTGKNQIEVHMGLIDHDEDDPVRRKEFDHEFEIKSDLFVVPEYEGEIKALKRTFSFAFKLSDDNDEYLETYFDEIVKRCWGGFTATQTHTVVGTAEGHNIIRNIYIYRRA